MNIMDITNNQYISDIILGGDKLENFDRFSIK